MTYPSIHSGVSQVEGAQFLIFFSALPFMGFFLSLTSGDGSARRCTSSTRISDWIFPSVNMTSIATVRCDGDWCRGCQTVMARSRFGYINTHQGTAVSFPFCHPPQHNDEVL